MLRPAQTRNIVAEVFCVNIVHNVAWVSKCEESKTFFASETQTLRPQHILVGTQMRKHSKSVFFHFFPTYVENTESASKMKKNVFQIFQKYFFASLT